MANFFGTRINFSYLGKRYINCDQYVNAYRKNFGGTFFFFFFSGRRDGKEAMVWHLRDPSLSLSLPQWQICLQSPSKIPLRPRIHSGMGFHYRYGLHCRKISEPILTSMKNFHPAKSLYSQFFTDENTQLQCRAKPLIILKRIKHASVIHNLHQGQFLSTIVCPFLFVYSKYSAYSVLYFLFVIM